MSAKQNESDFPSGQAPMHIPIENKTLGKILDGSRELLEKSYQQFCRLPVDQNCTEEDPAPIRANQQTIKDSVEVSAPGTFSKKSIRTLRLEPCLREGWWLERDDIKDSLPIRVSSRNVWTTGDIVSNIVLRSGNSSNYVRLVEHIIALKMGMDIDNLIIKLESGDPPLFNQGSLDLVEAIQSAGKVSLEQPVKYVTVKETVSIVDAAGGFLTISPCPEGKKELRIDCAREFKNAIGKQRIQFVLNEKNFLHGSTARTNTTVQKKLFCQTIGRIFADVRNLGYNDKNVLIAGKKRYVNQPTHMHNGKSLEAAWHRAILDLLAALALIEEGRFVGNIIDYKGGHFLDVEMVKLLYAQDLLIEIKN